MKHLGEPAEPSQLYPDLHNQLVYPGDLGGYIESEENLDQHGNCWVYDTSKVSGNARVQGDAVVGVDSEICDNSVVKGHALVDGWCVIKGNAVICGDSRVLNKSIVTDDCRLEMTASIVNSKLSGNICLGNRTWIQHSTLGGNIAISNTGDETERGKQQVHIFLSEINGNVEFTDTYTDISQSKLENVKINNIRELTEIKKAKLTDCTIQEIKTLQIEYTSLEKCTITNCTTVNLYEQELNNETVDDEPCFD